MKTSTSLVGASALLMVVSLATTGCATKSYVRQQVTPVQQRVDAIDQKHTQAVAQLKAKSRRTSSRRRASDGRGKQS